MNVLYYQQNRDMSFSSQYVLCKKCLLSLESLSGMTLVYWGYNGEKDEKKIDFSLMIECILEENTGNTISE